MPLAGTILALSVESDRHLFSGMLVVKINGPQ